MTEYPVVLDELATIAKLREGHSISRSGDGELKVMYNKGYVREPPNPKLAAELRDVLTNPHPNCLVGIPNMNPQGVKYENWLRHQDRFAALLSPDIQYVSAFITRPDNAQWINNPKYAKSLVSLWKDRKVVIVAEPGSKLVEVVKLTADVLHVPCLRHEAYATIDDLESKVAAAYTRDLAILSAGPTASCLANRLSRHGMQALDLGSVGGFIMRQLYSGKGSNK